MAYTPENNPYIPGDPYSYDLKWVVNNIKDLIANYTGQMDELKAFIMDYINSLDLSPIVAAELQEMYDNGDFDALIASFITDNKVLLVDTDQSTIFTEAEKETGRKNLRAGSTNPNLLDNPWFTVNQREQTTYTGRGYTVDRWVNLSTAATSVTINNNVLTLDPDTSMGFDQFLDNINLSNKTVTISVLYQDGRISAKTVTWPASGSASVADGIALTIYYGAVYQNKQGIGLIRNSTVSLRAVKLELGNVSTLANDIAPNYAEELAKCQRYFIRLKGETSAITMGAGYAISTTSTRILIPTPTTMAKVPTLTFAGSTNIFLVGNGQKVSPSNIGLPAFAEIQKNGVSINAYYSGLTANQVYALIAEDPTSYIDLSADL